MAKTYSQLLQNIETLKRQAEDRRKKEVAGVIGRIRDAIRFYGLTAADLGLGSPGGTTGRARDRKAGRGVGFRDAAGHTWSGRGPRPGWLKEALANGQSLDDLRVTTATPAAGAARRKRSGRKGPRVAKYRDAAGNTWGGMGKRPQWLRDALASGKQLEDFLIQPPA